ncbi:F-box domain-containing protein [Loa loa]|uniref:F-box domain-containing protein n=1 Tax=Loa loa TaxID=7209 RepID=A0A1I7VTH4_LOALO|nr:F-box domain-containing protein [Loa loa]EFO26725.2 F-box domain-containing protein [Loa loa]
MVMKKRKTKLTQLKRRNNTRKMVTRKRKRKGNIEDIENVELQSIPSTSSLQSLNSSSKGQVTMLNDRNDSDLVGGNYFPFSELPLNVQKKILTYLPLKCRVRLERVSMTWKRLLNISWQNITFADIPSTVTNSFQIRPIDDHHVCGFLQKCGRYLRYIDFFIPHVNIGRHVLFSICQRCVNLRELRLITDVNGCAMTNLLKEYSHQLAQLQSLSISYQAQDELYNGMRAVARSMTELRSFRLDCYTMPANVSALFPNSPHMRIYSLLLKQPANVSASSSSSIQGSTLQYECKYVRPEFVIDFFAYLGDVYLELEQLDISFDTNYPVNEEKIYHNLRMIGTTRALKRLNLRIAALLDNNTEWFGTRALQALAYFPTLTHLSLWTCALPFDLPQILAESPLANNLTVLRLAIVRNLSNNMLCAIFRALPSLTSFTLIYSVDGRFTCPACIDVLTFVQLFQYCPKISELELHDCVTVDITRLAIAAHSHFHNSSTSLGSDGCLKIVVKTRERKRRRDSLNRLLRCCTEIESTQNTTIVSIYKTCCHLKKTPILPEHR